MYLHEMLRQRPLLFKVNIDFFKTWTLIKSIESIHGESLHAYTKQYRGQIRFATVHVPACDVAMRQNLSITVPHGHRGRFSTTRSTQEIHRLPSVFPLLFGIIPTGLDVTIAWPVWIYKDSWWDALALFFCIVLVIFVGRKRKAHRFDSVDLDERQIKLVERF